MKICDRKFVIRGRSLPVREGFLRGFVIRGRSLTIREGFLSG